MIGGYQTDRRQADRQTDGWNTDRWQAGRQAASIHTDGWHTNRWQEGRQAAGIHTDGRSRQTDGRQTDIRLAYRQVANR